MEQDGGSRSNEAEQMRWSHWLETWSGKRGRRQRKKQAMGHCGAAHGFAERADNSGSEFEFTRLAI